MAIYAPGIRDRHNRPKRNGARNAIMTLSLTAMVDMFTVLAVFLLQNYQTDSGLLEINDEVALPMASAIKELRPATVITVSKSHVTLNKEIVIDINSIRAQEDANIPALEKKLTQMFTDADSKRKMLGLGAIRDAVQSQQGTDPKKELEDSRRVTVQGDKGVDFLASRRVLHTVTMAGASEVNFAVVKDESSPQ